MADAIRYERRGRTQFDAAMTSRTGSHAEDWCRPAVSIVEAAVPMDFVFDPGIPHDGRDLPDVDLDGLAEAMLSGLAPQPTVGGKRRAEPMPPA